MTDSGHEARLILCEWSRDAQDPDPEQRHWKLLYIDGMLEAARRTELLPPTELAEWQTVMQHGIASLPGVVVDADAIESHLSRLLADVSAMRRDDTDEARARRQRFHDGLAALRGAGLLDNETSAHWRRRALQAEAPWLEADEVDGITANQGGLIAISIPPETAQEAEADLRQRTELDRQAVRGSLQAVWPAQTLKRDSRGTALTAIVLRTESVELHFHHVSTPTPDAADESHLTHFSSVVDDLRPPTLTDDLGTTYEPLAARPVESHGTGGGNGRPHVITGSWRYTPNPPPDATRLTASLHDHNVVFHSLDAGSPGSSSSGLDP